MAGFAYFVRGAQTEARAFKVLREAGAAHATEGTTHKLQSPGPGGEADAQAYGLLVVPEPAHPGEKPASAYDAASQEWAPGPGGAYWVGFEKARPPRPEDLARAAQLPGHWVELGDGKRWLVPVARWISGEAALPRVLELTDEGEWRRGGVLARHAELWEAASRVWRAIEGQLAERGGAAAGEGGVEVSLTDEANLVVGALALNYRLGAPEVALAGLLTTACELRAVQAAVDWPSLQELLGKAEAPRSSEERSAAESPAPGREE